MPLLRSEKWNGQFGEPINDEGPHRPAPLHFDALALNAFDFFLRAFDEVATAPKYSVVHFYSAIELIFNRLLKKSEVALRVETKARLYVSTYARN
jgi:hypothetical protein